MSLNNISITSMAIGVNVVADVNICTTVCLPLIIRMRMRNNYAWTPVFFLDLLYSSSRVNPSVRFGKKNDVRHPRRMGNMKRSPQPI